MKLSEMARKAKEKLFGAFDRNQKEENRPEMAEMDAQRAQERQQDTKTGISSQNDKRGQETANNEATAAFEAATLASEAFETALREFGKGLASALVPLLGELQKIGKTETQIRKEELWRRYYREKAKMSNNERRRRGIPMVRRPKRQQYRIRRKQ